MQQAVQYLKGEPPAGSTLSLKYLSKWKKQVHAGKPCQQDWFLPFFFFKTVFGERWEIILESKGASVLSISDRLILTSTGVGEV